MLSNRLRRISEYIKKEDKVIDIGCDHALLDIYLVENNYVNSLIVSDVHEGALKQGIDNIKAANLEDKIDARLGNGLKVLNDNDDVNAIIISGMGTSTILDILDSKYLDKINKMVIQSNNDHELLRTKVTKMGFKITKEEYLVDMNKNYVIIEFVRGNEIYSKIDLKYGPILKNDNKYLEYELKKLEKILKLVPSNKLIIRNQLKKKIKEIKKLMK